MFDHLRGRKHLSPFRLQIFDHAGVMQYQAYTVVWNGNPSSHADPLRVGGGNSGVVGLRSHQAQIESSDPMGVLILNLKGSNTSSPKGVIIDLKWAAHIQSGSLRLASSPTMRHHGILTTPLLRNLQTRHLHRFQPLNFL